MDIRQTDQPQGLLRCSTGLYFPDTVSAVYGLPVMAVRPLKCKQVVTSRSSRCDSVRNDDVMTQHQDADAMQKISLSQLLGKQLSFPLTC